VPAEAHEAIAETGRKYCLVGGSPNARKKARQKFLNFLYDILLLVDTSLAGAAAVTHALDESAAVAHALDEFCVSSPNMRLPDANHLICRARQILLEGGG
jgi:hypothetical protein